MVDETKYPPDEKTVVVQLDPGRRKGSGNRPPKNSQKAPDHGGLYGVTDGKLCLMREGAPHPLCNFEARIVEEVLHDNGDEAETYFAIEGSLSDGTILPRIEVPAASFESLSWISGKWGARACRSAGSSNKDHLRAAIQTISGPIPRRTIYSHTGWRRIDGEWRYLHGGGALGSEGNRSGVEVDPGKGNMSLYRLPDPPEGEALREALMASLRLLELAPQKPELGAALLAATYRAATAEAAAIDHSLWLSGSTGNFKSETAGLGLAHYGAFTARSLTANFHDSESDIEIKSHSAKDALFVVDDFKPVGGATEVNRLHAKADRLIRGVGNQSGRGRRNANLQQRAAYHPRGQVIVTGEDLLRGQSARSRLTVAELARGDIDPKTLTELQQAATSGLLSQAMAGYVCWLSGQMDTLKDSLPTHIKLFRDEALAAGFATGHTRTASDYGSLMVGIMLLVEFATDCGALAGGEAASLQERCKIALQALMNRQADNQGEEDEVRRFFALLRSALDSGRCHISDRTNQGAPKDQPHSWGWRIVPGDDGAADSTKPNGTRIGWTDGVSLYLDGEASFATAQGLAREQGAVLDVSKATLWKRVHERGLLQKITADAKQPRLAIKQWIAGHGVWVYMLSEKVFESEQLST